MYRFIGKSKGLVDEDIESRGMGQAGVDIIFSPAAKKVFNHDIECKKHKRVVVPKHFKEHFEKYKFTDGMKLLFHENDRAQTLVTLRAQDFMTMVQTMMGLEDMVDFYRELYREQENLSNQR